MATAIPDPDAVPDPRDAFFDVSALKQGGESRAGRASLVVLGTSVFKLALHLGSTIVLARLIPPAEFGIAALALPVAIIAMNLSQFGLAQPIVQRPVITHRLVNMLFWVNLVLGLVLGGVLVAVSGAAARFYGVPEVGPVFAVLGVSVLASAILTQYVAILRRKMYIRLLEYGGLSAFAISVAVAIVAALYGASYWAVILQQVLQAVLTVAIFAAFVPWRPSMPRLGDLRGAGSALSFGGHLAIANLLEQTAQALPVIVIGRFYAPFEAGLFQRSASLARLLPIRFVSALASVFIGSLSRVQDDPAAFRSMFLRMMTRINMLMMPIGVLAFTTADIVVPFVLGPDWAAAAPVLAWLCLLLVHNTFDQGVLWAMIASDSSRRVSAMSMINLAIVGGVLFVVGTGGDIVVIAMVLMLAHMGVQQPIIAGLAMRSTPLDPRTLVRAYVVDLGVAAVAIGAVYGARAALAGAHEGLQMLAAIGIVAGVFGLRVLSDRELSADVMRFVLIAVRRR